MKYPIKKEFTCWNSTFNYGISLIILDSTEWQKCNVQKGFYFEIWSWLETWTWLVTTCKTENAMDLPRQLAN